MKNNFNHLAQCVCRSSFGIILLISFLALSKTGFAQQGITFNLLHQPCDHDGILELHDIAATAFPIKFIYNNGNNSITHISLTGYDTLINYNGGSLNVYTIDSITGQYISYGYYGGALPFRYTDSTTSAVCPGLGTATLNMYGGTPPFTFEYMDAAGNVVGTGNPVSLPGGYFDVKIMDAAGCVVNTADPDSSTQGIYIYTSSSVRASSTTTPANCTNGSVTLTVTGGVAPYSYLWNNGATSQNLTGLMMGTYLCTITDAQGCSATAYAYVQQSLTITPHSTVTNATCVFGDGSIVMFGSGGQQPYTYDWSNGQQGSTASNLTPGYYYVTITDANHCVGTGYAGVGSTTPITVTYTSTPTLCTAPTGTATVVITGGTPPYVVRWNTYPTAQTGMTATTLPQGTTSFNVTDALGCVRAGSAVVNPISIISASASSTSALCTQANGTAQVTVTQGTAPITYLWSNGSTNPSLSGLAAGSYSVKITDAQNCSVNKATYVNSFSPVHVGLNSVQASCIFASDGSIVATATGGTAPYSYQWDNGQSGTTATGLPAAGYTVYVSDAVGCTQNGYGSVGYNTANNSCYCTLKGRVYVDGNNNCTMDAGETGVRNIMIHCSGIGYKFTDAQGYYSFIIPSGNYVLSESVQAYYPLATCQSNAIPVTVTAASGCSSTHNFANVINPIHDIYITTSNVNQPIPGNIFYQKLVVENKGTDDELDIQAGYKHDGQLALSAISPSGFSQPNAASFPNSYSIHGGFGTLAPGSSQTYDISYTVPTNIPLGTSILFQDTSASASPINTSWLMDYTPWDNVHSKTAEVVGSFDPNNKEVEPKGTGVPGYITTNDSVLTYTTHYQNTGTYPAQKVVVVDTLDENLDITTLRPGYSNYSYVASINEQGVLKFTFDNIWLPTANQNPVGSIGTVMYTVHQKPNLRAGIKISSTASIYFDYNAPIQTNNPLNTIRIIDTLTIDTTHIDTTHIDSTHIGSTHIDSTHTSINIMEQNGFVLSVYPNPAHNMATLDITSSEIKPSAILRIYDLLGMVVQTKNFGLDKGRNLINLNISSLSSGLYFVEVSNGDRTLTQKLNVAK